MIGAHLLTPGESFGRCVGIDIDAHDPKDDPARNERYAEHLVTRLRALGFRALACHWGTGGFHVWIFFNQNVPGALLYAFARWLVKDATGEPWNYPKDVEAFPKQVNVAAHQYGNWLRVPGRHHTKDRFAAVYDGQEWVHGEPAVDYVLGCTGDSPDLIPSEARSVRKESQATRKGQLFRAQPAATGQPAGRERPDVFVEFNRQTSLQTVAEWHEQKGHRVIARHQDRIEFTRDGKNGSGQSFNVKLIRGVPLTYSFSTNAGMPPNEGLSPSQMRCFYETGSCDTTAMKRFAEKLREEFGWNATQIDGRGGGSRETPPKPGSGEPPKFVPRPWSDPVRLAESFLKDNIVLFVKKTGFFHEDGRYVATENETIDDRCWKLAEREALAEYQRRLAEFEAGHSEDKEPPTVPQVNIAVVNNMVRAVRSATRFPDSTLPGVWLSEPEFEGPPLCVANGILDLRTRELHPHTPWLFTLTKVPVAYDPNASKPTKFFQLLDELSCHDPDWILVLQESFGSCLDASLPWKYFTAFVGIGDNGKTVILNILRSLLGDGNHSAQTLAQLTGSQFGTFPLFGRLANIVGDESGFDTVKEGRLKELTGGETVAFEQKNKTPFFGPNTAKLIFGCNKLPPFNDDTEGIWNRPIIMPFDFVVPEDQKNPQMLTESFWVEELPGILNWSLDGLDRFRSQGRISKTAKRIQNAVQQHRVVSDTARQFLLENYTAATGEEHEIYVLCSGLYGQYREWFKAHGHNEKKYLLNSFAFGHVVTKTFPKSKSDTEKIGGKTHRVRRDIRLLTDDERYEMGRSP